MVSAQPHLGRLFGILTSVRRDDGESIVRRTSRSLLWVLALGLAAILIWRKLRIVVLVHVAWWQLVLLFLGLAVAIYLVFDVILGRRSRM